MKYRSEIDISFDSENDAIAFLNMIEEIKDKIYKGSEADGIENITKFRYHKCFHDENPPKQCGDYIHVDFTKPTEEHKTTDGKVYKATFEAKEKSLTP